MIGTIISVLILFGIIMYVCIKGVIKSVDEKEPEGSYNPINYAWDDPEYRSVITKHTQLNETIEAMYSVVYNLKLFDSDKADQVEQLCIEDINAADNFIRLYRKYHSELPRSYNSYKRLTILYEKQHRYDEAAKVCAMAISKGFTQDGTQGQMYGRLARMIRLANIVTPIDEYIKINANNTLK